MKTAMITQIFKYKLSIVETAKGFLNDESQTFNEIIEYFESIDLVKEYLIDRYGKMPKGRNKVYKDNSKNSSKPFVAGFLHSFWSSDISHNSPKWYQTDWICVSEVTETPINIL
jgi:hypothetical protein